MGREIRRVPAGWEHPTDKNGNYLPLFDGSEFPKLAAEWYGGLQLWLNGEHPYQLDRVSDNPEWYEPTLKAYDEYEGKAPKRKHYTPICGPAELTHFQVYETVSEGTPVSPVLESEEAVIEWWVAVGDYDGPISREHAERFVKYGSAPTLIMTGGGLYRGVDAP